MSSWRRTEEPDYAGHPQAPLKCAVNPSATKMIILKLHCNNLSPRIKTHQ